MERGEGGMQTNHWVTVRDEEKAQENNHSLI